MSKIPQLEPKVPAIVLNLTKENSIERHMLEQLSLGDQKNDLILERLSDGDTKFEQHAKLIQELNSKQEDTKRDLSLRIEKVSDRVKPFEKWADRFTGGKIVVTLILTCLGGLISIILAAMLEGWFAHYFSPK